MTVRIPLFYGSEMEPIGYVELTGRAHWLLSDPDREFELYRAAGQDRWLVELEIQPKEVRPEN